MSKSASLGRGEAIIPSLYACCASMVLTTRRDLTRGHWHDSGRCQQADIDRHSRGGSCTTPPMLTLNAHAFNQHPPFQQAHVVIVRREASHCAEEGVLINDGLNAQPLEVSPSLGTWRTARVNARGGLPNRTTTKLRQ